MDIPYDLILRMDQIVQTLLLNFMPNLNTISSMSVVPINTNIPVLNGDTNIQTLSQEALL
jgi:hypothetical protein